MRLFGVNDDGTFTEYGEQSFQDEHREKVLEDWLAANPDALVEGRGLMVVGRQVTTNLGTFIDLLALDRQANTVVIELKRGRTPRDTLAQALEYASFVEGLSYDELEQLLRRYTANDIAVLTEEHARLFDLADGEGVSFNNDQHIVLVGYDVTEEIKQTSNFLRKKGIDVTCVEFGFFTTKTGERVLSTEAVVGGPTAARPIPDVASLPKTTKDQFLAACDDAGRPMFAAILGLADTKGMAVHWGSRGFSLNAVVGGVHVPLCYAYPPSSVYKQSVYTTFADLKRKVATAEEVVANFKRKFGTAGFVAARFEMKLVFAGTLPNGKVDAVVDVVTKLDREVHDRGLPTAGSLEEEPA